MINNRQSLGKLGENIAVNFLKKKGYQILDRNFKTSRFGEIDIVALTKTDTDVIQTSTDKTQILVGKFKILDFIRNSFKFVIRSRCDSHNRTINFWSGPKIIFRNIRNNFWLAIKLNHH